MADCSQIQTTKYGYGNLRIADWIENFTVSFLSLAVTSCNKSLHNCNTAIKQHPSKTYINFYGLTPIRHSIFSQSNVERGKKSIRFKILIVSFLSLFFPYIPSEALRLEKRDWCEITRKSGMSLRVSLNEKKNLLTWGYILNMNCVHTLSLIFFLLFNYTVRGTIKEN